MEDNIIQSMCNFAQEDINVIYKRCFFQLIEDGTSVIYRDEDTGCYLQISVEDPDTAKMIFYDIKNNVTVTIVVCEDNSLQCDAEEIDSAFSKEIVARYLNLMEGFVAYVKED